MLGQSTCLATHSLFISPPTARIILSTSIADKQPRGYLALDVDATRPIVHCRDVRRILAYNHRALQLEGSSQLCIIAGEHEVVRQNRELLHLGSVRDSVLSGIAEPEQGNGVSSISVTHRENAKVEREKKKGRPVQHQPACCTSKSLCASA